MPKPLRWVKIKTSDNAPTARLGHTLVQMDRDMYIMFGGLDGNHKMEGKILPTGQVYTLRINNKGDYIWTQNDCEGDEVPLPRTNHAACKLGKDKSNEMFVFGGYYTSHKRFNDVHILRIGNSKKYTWNQPKNQKLGKSTPKNTESKIGAPEPRANHSCTYVEAQHKVYIFGGQGGVGYSRKSFNDIHSYCCETENWKKITPSGSAPKERGGHSASLLPGGVKILVYGGWSNISQYYNCYIFDTEKEDWQDLDTPSNDLPRWNHSAFVVPCLPESKIFVFGGERATFDESATRQFGYLDNNVAFMKIKDDMKALRFSNINIEDQKDDEKPLPRENSAMIYDKLDQRLIIFGGWSGNYLNDIWELNISSITGPDYAINYITPKLGPVTGGTTCEVYGDGFIPNKNYRIQFISSKPGSVPNEVAARYLSAGDGKPARLTCDTPNFVDHGKGDVEVRIISDRGDPTLGASKFSFFLNTSPKWTVCYGPGLLLDNSTEVDTSFFIQAKNKLDENRTSGKDNFDIKITYDDVEEVINEKDEKEKRDVVREVEIKDIHDYDNGLYKIVYRMELEKQVNISVKTLGDDNKMHLVRGSDYTASFSKDAPKENNSFTGPRMVEHVKTRLHDIKHSFEETKAGITPAENTAGGAQYETEIKPLLKIKENISQIKNDKEKNKLELEEIKQAYSQLHKEHKGGHAESEEADKLIHQIEKLCDKSESADKIILPYMGKQREKTKVNLEKFCDELKAYHVSLKNQPIYSLDYGYEDALLQIKEDQDKAAEFDKTLDDYKYYCQMLYEEDDQPASLNTSEKTLNTIKDEITSMKNLWEHIEVCEKRCNEFLNYEWKEVEPDLISEEIRNKMIKALNGPGFKKIDKKTNRTFIDFLRRLKNWDAFISLIGELRKPSMKVSDDRHWNEVRSIFNEEFEVDDDLKLELFWGFGMYEPKIKEQIEEITLKADQEAKIEKQLTEVDKKWRTVDFERIPLQLKEVKLETLKMRDEDVEKLEQDQLLIQTISASKYMTHFEDTVSFWQKGLAAINDTVKQLSDVQKTWSFLINLFRYSEEVKKELEKETRDFAVVDKEVEKLLYNSKSKPIILDFSTQDYDDDTVLAKLNYIYDQLNLCQKGLNSFIAEKRKVFPRFYFLTMEELLDILANGNNPVMLFKEKNYMSKVVQAADKLSMKENGDARPSIVSMNTCVGTETITFVEDEKSQLMGKVEIYLQDILAIIWKTLKINATRVFKDYSATVMSEVAREGDKASDTKVKWIQNNYAQLVLLVSGTGWARMTEDKFRRIQESDVDAMATFLKEVIANLTALIKLVQGQLDKPTRRKVMCLITMETHNRDIIDKLVTEKVRKADDFQWQSQLKFYYDDREEYFYCRIADAMLKYGYEYLGNGARLVVTPLTDRIYVTATQALHLKMGCAPAGPAGTGKTETTKDLASAVGKACYVFNCSPEMNYESMGNIFKGLASSGCWGCFDEFNRLVPEVLSVCTVQFKAVTDAIRSNKEHFLMADDEIKLDATCGAFITMNPGYLGRSELPEGLKALFRPITVVVPDLELICENILMSEGFVGAKILARKFVTLYSLCRDLLSKQDHYDWGLRAIKSVLVVAGSFKRAEPEIPEDSLLFRALRDFNYPKIALVDLSIFDGLLGDLFPGINIERKVDKDFETIIKDEAKALNYKDDPDFILKIMQLGELLEIRHCVFVMGPPGAGKTTTWKMLAKANTAAGNPTLVQDLDPKCVSTQDLYGATNMTTKEWKNGLLSHYMEEFSDRPTFKKDQPNKPILKWIILDGDLDANWIESMNSVMDDNKLLTLANNARIVVKDYMRLLFEIRDLKFATPATVSRAGILYISDDSGYQRQCYIESWLKARQYEPQMNELILDMVEKYVPKIISYLYKKCKFVTIVSYFGMTVAFCKMLQSQIRFNYESLYPPEEKTKTVNPMKLEHIFVLSCVWSFGGALTMKDNKDYRKEFSDWWKSEFTKPVKFKPKGTVFDYYVKMDETRAEFEEWKSFLIRDKDAAEKEQPVSKPQGGNNKNNDLPPNPFENVTAFVEYDGTVAMQNITVPIPETISVKLMTKSLIYEGHPTLMIGQAGSGKTQLIKGLLKEVRSASKASHDYYYLGINFNYYTDAKDLQVMLEQELVKQGNSYAPRKGPLSKLIYYIDDLNMPKLDPYNTQSAIALLRQHIDHAHWYDISKNYPILKEIKNTLVIAAMNPTSGSFFVNPRYQRHFWTCSLSFPESHSLVIIYDTFLRGHFMKFKPTVVDGLSQPLIKASIMLHERVSASFKKTAVNFHYEFNIRHLSNIFSGILQSQAHVFNDPEKIIKLWFHESERIYADRLIDPKDVNTYLVAAVDVLKKNFGGKNYVQKNCLCDNPEPLVFCHFPIGYQNDKYYDICRFDEVKRNVQDALEGHNEEKVSMNLVLFEDAIKHVCRITRITSNTAGHALLVGVGGSGKQSLTKLSAFIMSYLVFSITVSKEYNKNDLKTDLIDLFNKTGVKDEAMIFLMTDSHITNEEFLVFINDLLSSGEVADLYPEEEKGNIINLVRQRCKSEGKGDTNDEIWAFFIDKVRENLHVALCFSPIGDTFRTRARRFPALVNSTVIDWFQPWPETALEDVSREFLQSIDLGSDDVRKNIIHFMPESFKAVNKQAQNVFDKERRYIYNTPKSFLELINLYKNMLITKRKSLTEDKDNYEKGLRKLIKTKEDVTELEATLAIKQQEVDVIKAEAEKVAEVVGGEKEDVEKENDKAKVKRDDCARIRAQIEKEQTSCQKEVDELQPMVDEALEGVKSINKDDIKEMRGYNLPKGVTAPVVSCVQYLFADMDEFGVGIEISSKTKLPKNTEDWKMIKQEVLLNAADLIKKLLDFPKVIAGTHETVKKQLPEQNIEKLKVVLGDITEEQALKSSKALGPLLKFFKNMIVYYSAMKEMIPKQNSLREAQTTLAEKNQELSDIEVKVKELNEKLAVKQAELDEALEKRDAVQAEADKCNEKLSRARRLVSALDSEEKRWSQSIEDLTEKLSVLVGDVLICAAFISYSGPFSKIFRANMMKQDFMGYAIRKNIPMSPDLQILNMLVNEAQVAEWNNDGLPGDEVSIENGVILTNSERYPLMIDPQLQGITWIKEKLKKDDLLMLKLTDKTYAFDLERAIEDGQPVLIENLSDYIDPVIMPVIARNVIKKGSKQFMLFGGKKLDLHPNFRLYMQTKLSNPNYPPEVQAEAVLINFTVTEVGLGDQLLNFIVGKERPDLASTKKKLILEQNMYKISLKELEKGLLDKLNKATGDPTENIELIESLEDSKRLAVEITEKVEKAQVTTVKINEASEFYRPAATRGALIFFLMNELYKLCSFYMYSLESFVNVIDRAVDLVAAKYKDKEKGFGEASAVEGGSAAAEPGSNADLAKDGSQAELAQAGSQASLPENKEEEEGEAAALDASVQEGSQVKEGGNNDDDAMTPRTIRKRVEELTESITYCSFSFVRRGIFERHKVIFASMLCFRIMMSTKDLSESDYDSFIIPKKPSNVNYPENENLKSYISENIYRECKGLESIEKFQGLCDSLLSEFLSWKKWIASEKVEEEELPSKSFYGMSPFHKLMLIKILRPDRVSYALRKFLMEVMGERYIEQPPFDMQEVYDESNRLSPIFFVLFPGVDPTPAVEELGLKYKLTAGNGFVNLSMGQGQEQIARNEIFRAAKEGGWIFLQNVHLMQDWLKNHLELQLEEIAPNSHKDFRMFISSEPPPVEIPTMPIIPESILQRCIKVSNEAPSDLKANMRRAYAKFSQEKIDNSSKKNEYKSILYALCYFHAVVCGRKKFGSQGWSRVYNFNDGDLTICADVLHNYLEKYEVVPYNDLIYIYGEIMYGGHITDNWDRRTNTTYLKKLLSPRLLAQENYLFTNPNSQAGGRTHRMLDPAKCHYEDYRNYIEKLPDENPQMFGMHPNAEINFLLNQTEYIFQSIIELVGESAGGAGGKGNNNLVKLVINFKNDIERRTTNLIELKEKMMAFNKNEPPTPFQIVCMQECERMNQLIEVMVSTLVELELGLDGALNMTDAMDTLSNSLSLNRVPATWGVFYMSKKPLDSWFADLLCRCDQLDAWTGHPGLAVPKPLRLSYLFNPMSFLTAIMQITARENGLPLDNMTLYTRVTNFKDAAELIAFEKKPPPEKKAGEEDDEDAQKDEGGAYVDGFFLEGAAWEAASTGDGYLCEQALKTLHPVLPLIKVTAMPIEKKSMKGQYPCPVYYTTMRGPTYIFTANLTMEGAYEEQEEWRWIMGGVAAILNDDN